MLLRWSVFLLIYFLVNFSEIQSAKNYSPSRSSSSRGSSSGSHGSYGWKATHKPARTTHRYVQTTHRPFTQRTTTRRYHVTTMPTRRTTTRHYVMTTMPTRRTTTRHYVMTTMPTRRTTTRHYVMTTMPTHKTTTRSHNSNFNHSSSQLRTTKQPPYNPFFTTKSTLQTTLGKRNNSQLQQATSKQPPYNPFFSTKPTNQPTPGRYNNTHQQATSKQPPYNPFFSTKPTNQPTPGRYNNTHQQATSKQPPYNPFFSTKPTNQPTPGRYNNTHQQATSKQPPYNPFFSTKPTNQPTPGRYNNTHQQATSKQPPYNPAFTTVGRNNGSSWHSSPGPVFSTKATSKPFSTYHNQSRPNGNSTGNGNRMTPKPVPIQTTKIIPNNSNINSWRSTTSWRQTTPKPKFTGPSWNTSTHGSGGQGAIYRPPGQRYNTTVSRPSYITGSHPTYNPHTTYPTSTGTGTNIVNNNHYHYHPGGGYYQPSTGSTTNHVTIINNNNYYNPNHHVIIPTRHYYGYGPPAVGISVVNTDYYSYPVTSHYVSTYHYSTVDTGSTALGFYLGYQLGRISRPSYYYHSTSYVNNEYVPRYDHYTVHHYYHNSQSVPKETPIQPNAIVVCPGDSGAFCPSGNMPLCTNNGAVMCVVNAQSTVPCSDNIKTNCVKSSISCSGNNSPECKDQNITSVSIPCVSTAKIDAGVEFVNNSVVVVNPNDVTTKAFCVTVVAIPESNKNNTKANTTVSPKAPSNYSLPFLYTTNDTGVGLLGYYLGFKLQNLFEPSYSYLNYDNNFNYIEKFDHYNIFHYDHGADILPKDVEIKSDQLMKCAGDSGTFCPQNTSSLCLTDGAVICSAELSSTINNTEFQTGYINSNISCKNLTSPACISTPEDTITVQIPCISTGKVYAKTTYMIQSYGTGNNTVYYKTLEPVLNGTVVEPLATPRELCVTVLAIPGEKMIVEAPKIRRVTGIPKAPPAFSLPKYKYNAKDTGDILFGYYLAHRLETLAYPTYYYINAYLYQSVGEVQKYDHYSVHYNEYGKEILPNDLQLQASEIKGCEGDSGLICPVNTNTFCLNDGSVWCGTDFMLTKKHPKYNNTACVKSEIPCQNNKSPMCKDKKSIKINLACVATLTVIGDVMGINNTIYKYNAKNAKSYVDIQMVPGRNITNKAQHFCVTLVNIPVERKITEGEKFFENSNSVFGKIASKIFGF